ncbi:hypothetical protein DXG03_001563 [Asterophora parasitica]|uniref:Protein kinase domain-containing protein n=1 Tax=Asterophora parasitica TaxID=117018 RepID=A0A9P7G582_9AGAR|nr:hypothetical protein DXG03_001563 [Asterophora parasitica]
MSAAFSQWRPIDTPSPAEYLERVKARLSNDPNAYRRFLELVRGSTGGDAYFSHSNVTQAVRDLSRLLKKAPNLVRDLNAILPSNLTVYCPTTVEEVEFLVLITSDRSGQILSTSNYDLDVPKEPFSTTSELRELDDPNIDDSYKLVVSRRQIHLARRTSSQTLPPSLFLLNLEREDNYHSGGNFGDIVKGTIRASPVCLKVLRQYSQRGDTEKKLKAFFREVLTWSRLDHPNVLPFLGAHRSQRNEFVLVSIWCNHGNVSDFLKEHPDHDRQKADDSEFIDHTSINIPTCGAARPSFGVSPPLTPSKQVGHSNYDVLFPIPYIQTDIRVAPLITEQYSDDAYIVGGILTPISTPHKATGSSLDDAYMVNDPEPVHIEDFGIKSRVEPPHRQVDLLTRPQMPPHTDVPRPRAEAPVLSPFTFFHAEVLPSTKVPRLRADAPAFLPNPAARVKAHRLSIIAPPFQPLYTSRKMLSPTPRLKDEDELVATSNGKAPKASLPTIAPLSVNAKEFTPSMRLAGLASSCDPDEGRIDISFSKVGPLTQETPTPYRLTSDGSNFACTPNDTETPLTPDTPSRLNPSALPFNFLARRTTALCLNP